MNAVGRLRSFLLFIWAIASFGTCYFARDLPLGGDGQPLAYALAGQGILIVFIVLVVVNAMVFNKQADCEEIAGEEAGHGV